MRTNKLIYSFFVSLICLSVGIVISMMPTVREGLELLWLLPVAYAISIVLFSDLYSNWYENIGTIILFGSSLLRYIVTPFLMSLSQHTVAYISANTSSYRMAIFIMIYELYLVLIVLKFMRRRFLRKRNAYISGFHEETVETSFNVKWTGALFCALIIVVLIMRGNLQNVFSHFSFLTTYSEDRSDVYTYDRTFVYLLKSFAFIAIASKMGDIGKKNKSARNLCFIIAVLAALLNAAFYDHTARAILVEIIVSSVAVLIYCFPQKKKQLIMLFSIAGVLLVSTVFMFGTLQTTWSSIFYSSNMLERVSEMGELYANGVSTIAHTLDTYEVANEIIGIDTFFSGLFNSIGFITFPGFRNIYYAFANTPTAAAIFMRTLYGKGFILPPIGLALYYGGFFMFLPISILNCCLSLWCLYKIESRKYSVACNEGTIYIITYAEIICGMSLFVNNIPIMIQGLTEIPLLLFIILWINNFSDRIIIRK